jgi:hypothetical protein
MKNRNRKPSLLQLRVVGYILIRVIARKGQQQILESTSLKKIILRERGLSPQPNPDQESSQVR